MNEPNMTKKADAPKMDPRSLLEVASLSGDLLAIASGLREIQPVSNAPGTMAVLCTRLETAIVKLQQLRKDCEVIL